MSTSFYPLTIAEIRRETADAVSLRFDLPAEIASLFDFKAGQHLTLRTELDGVDVRRNYSVCVAPHDGQLRVAVKQIAGGVFSSWANAELRQGAVLDVMPPHGSFTRDFDSAERRSYVGIAGGSGITPVLSLLKTALTEEPKSRFTLLYGNRDSNSIMFLEELAQLKNRFLDRFELYHFLDDEEEEVDLFNGRLDRGKCDEIFERLVDPRLVDTFFICGPGPMMDAAEAALLQRDIDRRKILIERFTVDRPTGAVAAATAALIENAAGIRFIAVIDGRRRTVNFDPAKPSLLDSARAAGLPAPFACKAGVCATCRARIVSGRVEMAANYGLTEEEVGQGYILTCQAVPISDDVVIDYDA
jgi:ring-1,2-phenylacetyl-CoA epoxidase subunit PaaE